MLLLAPMIMIHATMPRGWSAQPAILELMCSKFKNKVGAQRGSQVVQCVRRRLPDGTYKKATDSSVRGSIVPDVRNDRAVAATGRVWQPCDKLVNDIVLEVAD